MPDDDFDEALGEAISGQVGKNTSNAGDQENTEDTEDTEERKNVKNYPCYLSEDLRDELDQLYNQYDGKNKVEGGDGIEKHKEFLEPIMRAAVDKLDLDDVVPYEPSE